MKKQDLEHIIRAAAAITNEYEIIVIGSQSILATYSNPPELLAESTEADVFPLQNPDMADLIDGSIGEGSSFHERFEYYAQGVGPETAILPFDWKDRLVKLQNSNTDMKIGYCLDPHDLVIAKLAAWREKDRAYLDCLFNHDLVDAEKVTALIDNVDDSRITKEMLIDRLSIVVRQGVDAGPR